MPQHQDRMQEGITAARGGEAANQPHPEARYQEAAGRMGVPRQWVSDPFQNTVGVTGRVKGRVGENLLIDASSTGGGATDSHMIRFPTTHLDDGAFQRHFVDSGTKFRFRGGWAGLDPETNSSKGIQWEGADIVRD